MIRDQYSFVSIIVPVYNGERYIGNCIKSLLELNYPSTKYEIIIVDNNSKDNTYRIVQEYPVVLIKEDRIQSSYAARNAGLNIANGEIIAFTDSDCVADKDWLALAVGQLRQGEDIGCVAGKIEGYSPSNYIEEYLVRNRSLSEEFTLNHRFLPYPPTANAIYRKDVFKSIGKFEENWISGGDADIAWRMQLHSNYRIIYCRDAVIYHIHRSTLKGFFKQKATWGYGEVLLHKKYKPKYGEQNHDLTKQIIKEYWVSSRSIARKLAAMVYYRYVSKDEKKYQDKMLAMIELVGRRFGRIKGSIKEREMFI